MSTPLRVWEPKELIGYANKTVTAPDTVYSYNNANYILLGMIIEKLTEKSYAENIQTRIAEPLGLTKTYLLTTFPIAAPHAHGYSNDEGSLEDRTD